MDKWTSQDETSRDRGQGTTSLWKARLDAVVDSTDASARLDTDPLRYAHRYTSPGDREIAGLIAAVFAYGRVAAFARVLEPIFARADAAGGPVRWLEGLDPRRERDALDGVAYRFQTAEDVALWVAALAWGVRARGRLAPPPSPASPVRGERLAVALGAVVDHLVADAAAASTRWGFGDPTSRGFRYLLPHPRDGSACKRLVLWARWMVRREHPDLGAWEVLTPADLLMPLDTHVARVSRFLGWTRRADASWRTAVEITEALAVLDPADPTRYDFALAHLGISGACLGHRDADICRACPLDDVCCAPHATPRR